MNLNTANPETAYIGKSKNKFKKFLHSNPHFLFIMPSVAIMALLTFIPTVLLYGLSFTDYELGSKDFSFVGFENFTRLFSGQDAEFWYSFGISIGFVLIVTFVELILGLLIALLLNQDFKLKAVIFGCLVIPIAMTPAIVGQVWKLMMNSEYGVINYLLSFLNLKVTWLGFENAYLSTILIDIWQFTPFVALIIYAGIRSIPMEPYEAAFVDGASKFQAFRYITLPLIKPVILLAILFRAMDGLKNFDVPFILTQGGPGSQTEFLSLHIYRLAFAQTGWIGRASATAVVLVIVSTILTMVILRFFRKGVDSN